MKVKDLIKILEKENPECEFIHKSIFEEYEFADTEENAICLCPTN